MSSCNFTPHTIGIITGEIYSRKNIYQIAITFGVFIRLNENSYSISK